MASYVPGNVAIAGFGAVTLEAIELRVISNLLQTQMVQNSPPGLMLDELRVLRNDQAYELGITPPTVPGN